MTSPPVSSVEAPSRQRSSLTKTIVVWAILLIILGAGTYWRMTTATREDAIEALESQGGTASMASGLFAVRSKGQDGWGWIATNFLDYVEGVDLSIHAKARLARQAVGDVEQPLPGNETLMLLQAFPRLRQVNLRGSMVTDDGLQTLQTLSDIEKVDVSGTQVTVEGIAAFRELRPNCQVIDDEVWEFERSPLAEEYWLGKQLGL